MRTTRVGRCGGVGVSRVRRVRGEGGAARRRRAVRPVRARDPEAPRSVEETPIGGLGIMMVKRLMDAHSYRYVDGCNEVTIAKRW